MPMAGIRAQSVRDVGDGSPRVSRPSSAGQNFPGTPLPDCGVPRESLGRTVRTVHAGC